MKNKNMAWIIGGVCVLLVILAVFWRASRSQTSVGEEVNVAVMTSSSEAPTTALPAAGESGAISDDEPFMGYRPSEIEQASSVIMAEIANFGEGFELHSLDPEPERNNDEELAYINSMAAPDKVYTHVLVMASSFHTPTQLPEMTAWEPDTEYTYDWYLGRTDDGVWELVTYGYL